jgi:hypothetical protein
LEIGEYNIASLTIKPEINSRQIENPQGIFSVIPVIVALTLT